MGVGAGGSVGGKAPPKPPKKKTKAQSAASGSSTDLTTPPAGVSASFWKNQIDAPRNANAVKAIEQGQAPKGYASIEDWLSTAQSVAANRWKRLTPQERSQYEEADATGGPDPSSPEGKIDTAEETVKEREQVDLNNVDWANLGMSADQLTLTAGQAALGNANALEQLKQALGNIKDPELSAYVGDYVAQLAQADPRDIEAQNRQLAKLERLSDPTITPEEKLMMEMSRREAESTLRGARGAQVNDLQARGVYGSGAELTMAANSQAEAAQRHALELLGAQSNAQKRSMEALFGAKDLATSMRGSSANESQFNASAQNSAAEFNKNIMNGYNQWKDKMQQEQVDAAAGRAKTAFDATGQVGRDAIAGANTNLLGRNTVFSGAAPVRQQATKELIGLKKLGISKAAGDENEEDLGVL